MSGDYVDKGDILGTGYTFIFLGIISVAARFIVRKWKKTSIGPDDWLSLSALVFVIGYCITMLYGAYHHSFGSHGNRNSHSGGGAGLVKATGTLRNPAIGLTKLSVLFFYRRVFQTHKRGFRFALWTTVVLVASWTVAFTVLDIFDCKTPVSNLWKHKNECVNEREYNSAQAILDVILDAILFTLPLPTIWQLQMEIRKKLLVSLVFALGMFSMVAAILRLLYVLVQFHMISNKLGLDTVKDRQGSQNLSWFWTMVEVGVGIVATCMPTLAPLLFESNSAYTSLKATLSGFLPLRGRDTSSEKTSLRGRENGESVADRSDSDLPRITTPYQIV